MIVRTALRLGVVAMGVGAALVPIPASWVETWYSRGVYPALQTRLTPLTNQVPIALLDLAAGLLILFIAWRGWSRWRRRGFVRASLGAAASGVTAAAALYLAFLGLWGLNYRRVPLGDTLDVDHERVTPDAVRLLARTAVARVNELHAPAQDGIRRRGGMEASAFVRALRRVGVSDEPAPGLPKRSALQLYFRYAAIDGMTNPFFHEIILNADLAAFERPFVLAHEWAHLAGYANEDEANLIAWLACLEGDALARYSGWLAVYELALGSLPRAERRAFAEGLVDGPRHDLRLASERYARAPPVVRAVARETYDTYLKANRVEEGIASYDQVIRLILAAGPAHGWAPRARLR